MQRNMLRERDIWTEKSIYYLYRRFRDSSKEFKSKYLHYLEPNLTTIIKALLKTKTDGWTCVYYVGMYVKLNQVLTFL